MVQLNPYKGRTALTCLPGTPLSTCPAQKPTRDGPSISVPIGTWRTQDMPDHDEEFSGKDDNRFGLANVRS